MSPISPNQIWWATKHCGQTTWLSGRRERSRTRAPFDRRQNRVRARRVAARLYDSVIWRSGGQGWLGTDVTGSWLIYPRHIVTNAFKSVAAVRPGPSSNSTWLSCALSIITDHNAYSLQYTELYKAHKYLLTLPLTQVTCETSFLKLKFLKTRLRSTIVQGNLESLFLMQRERDI